MFLKSGFKRKNIILTGRSGSGKSTLAKQIQEKDPSYTVLEEDQELVEAYREMLGNPKLELWNRGGNLLISKEQFDQLYPRARELIKAKVLQTKIPWIFEGLDITSSLDTNFPNTRKIYLKTPLLKSFYRKVKRDRAIFDPLSTRKLQTEAKERGFEFLTHKQVLEKI